MRVSDHPGKQFSKDYQPGGGGRQKGSVSLKTIIREIWNEEIDDNGSPKARMIKAVKALIEKAEEGDVYAFREIANRLEGLPKQFIEGDFNQNINFFEQMAKKSIPERVVDNSE